MVEVIEALEGEPNRKPILAVAAFALPLVSTPALALLLGHTWVGAMLARATRGNIPLIVLLILAPSYCVLMLTKSSLGWRIGVAIAVTCLGVLGWNYLLFYYEYTNCHLFGSC